MTIRKRLLVWGLIALAAWVVLGAGVTAALLLVHWATAALHGMVHGQP